MGANSDNYAGKSHRQLLEDCLQGGSVEAWQEFVHRFQPLISAVVAQVARGNGTVTPTLVDDLVQETYLRLCADDYRLLRNFTGGHENSLFGYLKVTAASVALDYFKALRTQKRGGGFQLHDLEEGEQRKTIPEAVTPPIADQTVLLAEIDRVLKKVTEGPDAGRDRLIFRLYYQQGFTAKDIAEFPALKLTAKGIESLLYRITASVRQELAGRHVQNLNVVASPGE